MSPISPLGPSVTSHSPHRNSPSEFFVSPKRDGSVPTEDSCSSSVVALFTSVLKTPFFSRLNTPNESPQSKSKDLGGSNCIEEDLRKLQLEEEQGKINQAALGMTNKK
jgi:hypothetical protein